MIISKLYPQHHQQWLELYKGYAEFYNTSYSDASLQETWQWLMDPAHPCQGIVAIIDDKLVALAHFKHIPSPLIGKNIGYLDDIFVLPNQRNNNIGRKMILHVKKIAAEQGWPIVRWITKDNNYRARNLYDQLADSTDWVTYDMQTNSE